MKKIVAIIFLIFAAISSQPAAAYTCWAPQDIREVLRDSDVMFIGRVESIEKLPPDKEELNTERLKVRFRVGQVWKGLSEDDIEVYVDTESFYEYKFTEGENYLVMAYRLYPNRLSMVGCPRVMPIAESASNLRKLGDPVFTMTEGDGGAVTVKHGEFESVPNEPSNASSPNSQEMIEVYEEVDGEKKAPEASKSRIPEPTATTPSEAKPSPVKPEVSPEKSDDIKSFYKEQEGEYYKEAEPEKAVKPVTKIEKPATPIKPVTAPAPEPEKIETKPVPPAAVTPVPVAPAAPEIKPEIKSPEPSVVPEQKQEKPAEKAAEPPQAEIPPSAPAVEKTPASEEPVSNEQKVTPAPEVKEEKSVEAKPKDTLESPPEIPGLPKMQELPRTGN